MPNPRRNYVIYAVEDDPVFSRMLQYLLELDPDHQVTIFSDAKTFLNKLPGQPDLVTIDFSLPDMEGEELLKRIKSEYSDLPVIVISGQQDIKTAVKLLKLGADDYITKDPEAGDILLNSINRIKQKIDLLQQLETLKEEVEQKYDFGKTIIGSSPPILRLFNLLEKAASNNITISITGATGTGKEVVAKSIHYNSPRKNKPFVPVNVASIPSELMESELFGHEKGAFTGAIGRRVGKFEEANGGTLFLDEIGEMPVAMQAKLLRVLQEKEVVRVGGNNVVKLDVRLIVATHRNLADMVDDGDFREDLYYRLLGLSIILPSLYERGDDVILLAKHFLDDFARHNKTNKIKITSDAVSKLKAYQWPGNIRELKAVIELAAVMADNNTINADNIIFSQANRARDLLVEEATLQEYIYKIVKHYLAKYDNNAGLVAKKLKIGKSTVYRYINEMKKINFDKKGF